MNVSFYGIKALRTDAIKVEVHSLLQIVTVFIKSKNSLLLIVLMNLYGMRGSGGNSE